MTLPTLHDTLRHIIRSIAWRDQENQQRALLSVDAHERQFGTADTDAYAEELRKQAEAALPPTPEALALQAAQSAEERARAAEAEVTRLQALVAAQSRPSVEPPAVPAVPPSA